MNVLRRIRWMGLLFSIVFLAASGRSAQEEDVYQQAALAFEKRNYESAAKLFEQADKADPGKTDALLMAAKARVHLQQFETAETVLRNYLTANPRSGDAWYLLGFVLNRENKARDSLDVYTRAASIASPTGDDLKIVARNY